jgi:hypothetical protein
MLTEKYNIIDLIINKYSDLCWHNSASRIIIYYWDINLILFINDKENNLLDAYWSINFHSVPIPLLC